MPLHERRERTSRLEVLRPECAVTNVGKVHHYVTVDPDRCADPVRKSGSARRDRSAMAACPEDRRVSLLATESTSAYSIPA